MKKLLFVVLPVLLTGCATSFTGSAKIKDGPKQCQAICQGWDMELVGMVALGEYTDGCVCKVKGKQLSMKEAVQSMVLAAAGVDGGAAGVVMQMQRAAAQQ